MKEAQDDIDEIINDDEIDGIAVYESKQKSRRTFTAQEKLDILREIEFESFSIVTRKYKILPKV